MVKIAVKKVTKKESPAEQKMDKKMWAKEMKTEWKEYKKMWKWKGKKC